MLHCLLVNAAGLSHLLQHLQRTHALFSFSCSTPVHQVTALARSLACLPTCPALRLTQDFHSLPRLVLLRCATPVPAFCFAVKGLLDARCGSLGLSPNASCVTPTVSHEQFPTGLTSRLKQCLHVVVTNRHCHHTFSFVLFKFVTCNNHHGSRARRPSSCCSRDYVRDMPTPAVVVLGVLLGSAIVCCLRVKHKADAGKDWPSRL